MSKNQWSREQTIIALNLYCKIPFNLVSSNHPDILKISKIIRRSPNSMKMKIGNFGSFDSELKKRGIVGLTHASRLDKEVWEEFNSNWEDLAFESEKIIAKFLNKSIEDTSGIDLSDIPLGKERESIVKTPVNQNFFRKTILSSYNYKCSITGLSIVDLLVAGHLVPWSENKKERLNPRNGICLNYLHDKAFDRGLITISSDYRVMLSNKLKENKETNVYDFFIKYENERIFLPDKFLPDKEFIEYHNDFIFQK